MWKKPDVPELESYILNLIKMKYYASEPVDGSGAIV